MATIRKKAAGARIEGVTVSPMAKPGGVEVILGVLRDPQYGATMMFGLGGIFTEIYRDVQLCLLPAAPGEFERMIAGIKGYPILAGARGRAPKDIAALTSWARMRGISLDTLEAAEMVNDRVREKKDWEVYDDTNDKERI